MVKKTLNRRGNLSLDIILAVVIFLILAVVAFVSVSLYDSVNDDIQSEADISASAKDLSDNINSSLPTMLDYGFLSVFLFLWLFLLLSSFFLDNNALFFIIMLTLMVAAFFVAGSLQDFYYEFVNDVEFISTVGSLPIINYFMSNLFMIALIVGFSVLIVLYSKNQIGGGPNY